MALNAQATQNFVPIKEVRDGIIVLKDGGLRTVLMASSINLALKSQEEQEAIIYQFQSFLNSIEFSTQIVVQSRRLDIQPYLLALEGRMKEQLEPLLKIQTREYMDFIRSFTEQYDIMSKHFYIVVPYTSTALGKEGTITKFLGGSSSPKGKTKREDELIAFEEKRTQLEQRMGIIQGGLSRMGIRTTELGTEEIIELLYRTFNPGEVQHAIKVE